MVNNLEIGKQNKQIEKKESYFTYKIPNRHRAESSLRVV